MKTTSFAKFILTVALCAAWTNLGHAAALNLDFSATGGTILDTGGQGTGFTTRLTGSGANHAASDINLDIDTAAGVLRIDPTNADINGQVGMPDLEAIGINLSTLGFTGAQDFSVIATFVNIPDNVSVTNPDQLNLFVGTNTTSLIRAGFINFDQFLDPGETRSNEGFGVNTNGTNDSSARFFGADVGTTMTIEIGRTGGVWRALVNGVDRLPNTQINGAGAPVPPTFLDDETNLIVGITAMDIGGNDTAIYELDSFQAVVAAGCDADGMNGCTIADFNLISDNLFDSVPAGTLGDLSGNGRVGYEDFRLWKDNFIPGAGGGGVGGIVPEPASWVLVTVAFLGFSWLRRRGG